MKTYEPKSSLDLEEPAKNFKLTTYEPGKGDKAEDDESVDEFNEQENVVLDAKALR